MKKDITKEMENEIKARKKLSKETKAERDKRVFRNLLFAILIIIYLIFINLGYYNIEKAVFVGDTAIFSMVTLVIAIILFEKSYKTEKGYLAIHGIEILTVALFTYFIPYTYFNFGELTSKLCMLIPIAFAIYYCIKGIIICIKANRERKSDIKDIVKKEEKKNDDTWVKMDKDKEAETEEKRAKEAKEDKEAKPKKEKKTKQRGETEKKTTKPKTVKKDKVEETDKIEEAEKKPRKRKRTAEAPKEEKKEIKEKIAKQEEKVEEPKKKTKGRPKKAITAEETKPQEVEKKKTTKTNKTAKTKKESEIKTQAPKRTRKKKEE